MQYWKYSLRTILKGPCQVSVPHSPEFITTAYKPDDTTQSKSNAGGYLVCENRENSRWIRCPVCGGKTRTRIFTDTVLINFPLYCPKCRKEINIDVVQLKMVLSKWARCKTQSLLPLIQGESGSHFFLLRYVHFLLTMHWESLLKLKGSKRLPPRCIHRLRHAAGVL